MWSRGVGRGLGVQEPPPLKDVGRVGLVYEGGGGEFFLLLPFVGWMWGGEEGMSRCLTRALFLSRFVLVWSLASPCYLCRAVKKHLVVFLPENWQGGGGGGNVCCVWMGTGCSFGQVGVS